MLQIWEGGDRGEQYLFKFIDLDKDIFLRWQNILKPVRLQNAAKVKVAKENLFLRRGLLECDLGLESALVTLILDTHNHF